MNSLSQSKPVRKTTTVRKERRRLSLILMSLKVRIIPLTINPTNTKRLCMKARR